MSDPLVDHLRRMRLHLELSQSWVGSRIGTTQSAISELETGETGPTLKTLRKWAGLFGYDLQFVVKSEKGES